MPEARATQYDGGTSSRAIKNQRFPRCQGQAPHRQADGQGQIPENPPASERGQDQHRSGQPRRFPAVAANRQPACQNRREGHPHGKLQAVADQNLATPTPQTLDHPQIRLLAVDPSFEVVRRADDGLVSHQRDVEEAGDDHPRGQFPAAVAASQVKPARRERDGPFPEVDPRLIDGTRPIAAASGQRSHQRHDHEQGHRQVDPARSGQNQGLAVEDQDGQDHRHAGNRSLPNGQAAQELPAAMPWQEQEAAEDGDHRGPSRTHPAKQDEHQENPGNEDGGVQPSINRHRPTLTTRWPIEESGLGGGEIRARPPAAATRGMM